MLLNKSLFVLVLVAATASSCGSLCAAFSAVAPATPFQVVIPLQQHRRQDDSTQDFVHKAFCDIVDSTDFMVRRDDGITACRVPALGADARISLTPETTTCPTTAFHNNDNEANSSAFVLSVDGVNISLCDFGFVCAKFYECKDSLEGTLDLAPLRAVVASHFNSLPPHPGYLPTAFGAKPLQQDLNPQVLQTLQEQGYVVIDDVFPKTHPHQHAQLSAYLQEKTNQGNQVRRDTVHFLHQEQAAACGMQEHFTHLMSIATHLNRHYYQLRASPYAAVAPASEYEPLTVPRAIQLAEYGEDDFYVAHSDNSLSPCGTLRNNFRHFTCILYLNSNWTSDMGGALRLYLNSRHYSSPDDAVQQCDYVDVLPENGRLLIFDSCLVHAVRQVTQGEQTRRALTLWINRPNDSGVPGEVFY